MKVLHNKIQDLKRRAKPITYSATYVDENGQLQNLDFKPAASEADRTIKGYLTVWGVRDTYGTAFIKGAFAKSIAERGPASSAKQKIAHLWMHDASDPIGQFTILKEDNYGLYFEAVLDAVENGDRALTQVRSGTLNQFSVGFDYIWDKMEYDESTDTILIYEANLMEGSVVTFGSCDETYAIRSSEQLEVERERLTQDTEYFIRSLPKDKQLESRTIIKRHISLTSFKPEQPLDQIEKPSKDLVEIGGYKLNVKQFIK